MELQRFIPPNLRQPLREIGGLGSSLIDSVIDFGGQVRRDPIGTNRAIGQGIIDATVGAVQDPVGTARGAATEFAASYDRARRGADAYLPEGVALENATMEQIEAANKAYLADITGLSAVVPAVGPVMRGARAVGAADYGALTADAIGAGRAIASGDLDMLGEVFQPSGTARSLSAGSPNIRGVANAPNFVSGEDLAAATPVTISGADYFEAPRGAGGRAKDPALYTPFSSLKQTQVAPSDWRMTGRRLDSLLDTPTRVTAEDVARSGATDMFSFTADSTPTQFIVDSVNDLDLPLSVMQQGGHTYIDQPSRGFASEAGVLAGKNRAWQDVYNRGGLPIVTPMTMGTAGGDFSQHVSQTQAQLIRAAAERGLIDPNFTPKLPAGLLDSFVGLTDPRLPAYVESLKGGQRAQFMKALDTGPAMGAGVPSVAATRFATMDPNLIGTSLLDSGYRLFQPAMSSGINIQDGRLHATYSGAVDRTGDSMTMGAARPWTIMFPDEAFPRLEATTPRGANQMSTAAMPKDLRAFQMNPQLRQMIDQQWVDANMRYDEILRNRGKAEADMYAMDAMIARASRQAR